MFMISFIRACLFNQVRQIQCMGGNLNRWIFKRRCACASSIASDLARPQGVVQFAKRARLRLACGAGNAREQRALVHKGQSQGTASTPAGAGSCQ